MLLSPVRSPQLSDSCAAVEEVHVSVPSGETSATFCTLPFHPHSPGAQARTALVYSQMHMDFAGTSHLTSDSFVPYLLGMVLTSRIASSGSGLTLSNCGHVPPQRDSRESLHREIASPGSLVEQLTVWSHPRTIG